MFERMKNFFVHGMFATDEQLGIKNPLKEKTKKIEEELEKKSPVKMEKEDKKAFMIAAFQVFVPIVAVMLILVLVLLFITAKYFN